MPLFLIATRLAKRLNRFRAAVLIAVAALIVIVGGVAFALTQHISVWMGLYWSITTATTVGYGDVTPDNTAGRIIANAVMLTTIPIVGAVFALFASATIVKHVRRLLGMDNTLPSAAYTAVYGTHPVLARVLSELADGDEEVLLVAPSRPVGGDEGHHFISGDPTDEAVVRRSRPAQANRALVACATDADTLVTAVHVHALAPDLEIYALSQSPNVASALEDLGVRHTLSSDDLVGHTLAKSLQTPQAGDVLLSLIDGPGYRMEQTTVGAELIGQKLSQARSEADSLVLGLSRDGDVDLGVARDPVIAAGDTLILVRAKKS